MAGPCKGAPYTVFSTGGAHPSWARSGSVWKPFQASCGIEWPMYVSTGPPTYTGSMTPGESSIDADVEAVAGPGVVSTTSTDVSPLRRLRMHPAHPSVTHCYAELVVLRSSRPWAPDFRASSSARGPCIRRPQLGSAGKDVSPRKSSVLHGNTRTMYRRVSAMRV